jgi:hypothetical protein
MGAPRDRLGHCPALLVDPGLALGRPVGEADRRVAERVGERVPRIPARNATGISASAASAAISIASPAFSSNVQARFEVTRPMSAISVKK